MAHNLRLVGSPLVRVLKGDDEATESQESERGNIGRSDAQFGCVDVQNVTLDGHRSQRSPHVPEPPHKPPVRVSPRRHDLNWHSSARSSLGEQCCPIGVEDPKLSVVTPVALLGGQQQSRKSIATMTITEEQVCDACHPCARRFKRRTPSVTVASWSILDQL
jgi:hypothetical protein